MPMGPGKYDDLATYVRDQARAECVVVVVLGGIKGSGFSVQASTEVNPSDLVGLLRDVAHGIEVSARGS